MPVRPSITYWQRVEPSPRADSLAPGLAAAVRDPLWFLTRQWQLGEFQGEDAASPAYTTLTLRSSTLDSWAPASSDGASGGRPYDGTVPLEALVEAEPVTPDRRTAVELGQALERRLRAALPPTTAPAVVDAFRTAFPVPTPGQLSDVDLRDPALVRLARISGGRATDGLAALAAARTAAPGVPASVPLPGGTFSTVAPVLATWVSWVDGTLGPIATADPPAWRPDRLEYAVDLAARTPAGLDIALSAHAGTHGEFDWYSFDEARRGTVAGDQGAATTASLLPAPVRFAGMPDPRWWNFEDARVNWAAVDTDRRDLARLLVVDFMLVQGNDWFTVPCGHSVGDLLRVDQLLVRDVFGELTVLSAANDPAAPPGRQRWAMFATAAGDGLADYTVLPPSALRTTMDGPDLEEVRFVRDEQANLVWGVETLTEDGTGRPRRGADRNAQYAAPDQPPVTDGLRYRLQTTVPVHWIPFVPVQIDDTRRAVALERAAMQRETGGQLVAVAPAGRVLRPTGLADPQVYRIPEEEVGRSGTRVLRAAHRTRWVDGSTHLWTARRRRVGLGEAGSGLRYDVVD